MSTDRKAYLTSAKLQELLLQNRTMRELLTSWPARKVMMGYEKDWNQKRQQFLESHQEIDIQLPSGSKSSKDDE